MKTVKALFNVLQDCFGSVNFDLTSLLKIYRKIDPNNADFEDALCGVVLERIVFACAADVPAGLNFEERRQFIETRLGIMGFSSPEIPNIAHILNKFLSKFPSYSSTRKMGVSSLSSSEYSSLLKASGHRCQICGIPLRSRVQGTIMARSGIREPVAKACLDHVLPFYLGGNTHNLRIICDCCNTLKSDCVGLQEDGSSLCLNTVRPRSRERAIQRIVFWSMHKGVHCTISNCGKSPMTSMIWHKRANRTLPWAETNIAFACNDHCGSGFRHIAERPEIEPEKLTQE